MNTIEITMNGCVCDCVFNLRFHARFLYRTVRGEVVASAAFQENLRIPQHVLRLCMLQGRSRAAFVNCGQGAGKLSISFEVARAGTC